MEIFEIRPNHEFIWLTKNIEADLRELVDIGEDGVWELMGVQNAFVPEAVAEEFQNANQGILRFFEWSGEEYVPMPTFADE
jgi:hypothetical protein